MNAILYLWVKASPGIVSFLTEENGLPFTSPLEKWKKKKLYSLYAHN